MRFMLLLASFLFLDICSSLVPVTFKTPGNWYNAVRQPGSNSCFKGKEAIRMTETEPVHEGDIVVVVGATGGVGRLVTESLVATDLFKVRGVVRDLEKAEETLGGIKGLELVEGDILRRESLDAAMKDASCVVACTGTTAFPSGRWAGGNTPDAVDNLAVINMLEAATDPANHAEGAPLKRFVLLSSVGVGRRGSFPFSILNTFGVLDAKAKGEEAVRTAAAAGGFSYAILRPGRLVGEPFTSPDVAALTKADTSPMKRGVSMKQGDAQAGDVNRGSVAEAFVQAIRQSGAANKSFTIINVAGEAPTKAGWDKLFDSL